MEFEIAPTGQGKLGLGGMRRCSFKMCRSRTSGPGERCFRAGLPPPFRRVWQRPQQRDRTDGGSADIATTPSLTTRRLNV